MDLKAFEREIAEEFEKGNIRGPVHLSGGNEDQLTAIFKLIGRQDWVFSTWRNHYHALLHGVPPEFVREAIMAGKSMNLCYPEYRFYTSAIVGGILPIALGVAAGIKRGGGSEKVWCFVGDMAATTGVFHEANRYAGGHDLPITFVIEDNWLSTNTPTHKTWGMQWGGDKSLRYYYERTHPHVGTGKWVNF